MRFRLALIPVTVVALLALLGATVFAQGTELAPRGVGLIPPPAETAAPLAGAPPAHPFIRNPSGEFSRIIFATDEGPNFNIVIRDYFFPPNPQTYNVMLLYGGLLRLLSGHADVRINNEPMPAKTSTRAVVPIAAALSVTNYGEIPVVLSVLTLEAK